MNILKLHTIDIRQVLGKTAFIRGAGAGRKLFHFVFFRFDLCIVMKKNLFSKHAHMHAHACNTFDGSFTELLHASVLPRKLKAKKKTNICEQEQRATIRKQKKKQKNEKRIWYN